MEFSLIICTYQRPEPLQLLLQSVIKQSLYPNEIIIVDGSLDVDTEKMLQKKIYKGLRYFRVDPADRGLTRQRNFGISKVASTSEIICFLDDDTILSEHYFKELLNTYQQFPNALAVGGYITNETTWFESSGNSSLSHQYFCYDGFCRKESSRFKMRKKLGLDSNVPPGFSPNYSHGRSVSFLPPSGKIYPVEQIMGGVSSFKKSIFDQSQFSTYFEGYGLYEDADFSIRLAKTGLLYLNTAAQLEHHHAPDGRPNQYQYGKMVVRNGWYVWRVKNLNPNIKDWFKWHAITILLTAIRATNILTTSEKKKAFTETIGRLSGWVSLIFDKPGRS
ncbi:glycosyltransferase [Flavobacterium sp. NST-5]|uniref:Glycosyltransferase n=1 Tax=Flavobacterium ichthyis TaxID=2698827 RepID=A0ABW9ZCM4_9FLAO|nr:glycosyltransferase [Flavobacterium ichthyis]NBL64845.1 glycosyltransferase [Flavobacterium ichthyis]